MTNYVGLQHLDQLRKIVRTSKAYGWVGVNEETYFQP